MFVNEQHSTVTLYCNKVPCCGGSYLEFKFITFHYQLDNSLIYSLLTVNCIDISLHVLINCSTFKDVILHYYPLLSIQSGVHLIEIFNNSN